MPKGEQQVSRRGAGGKRGQAGDESTGMEWGAQGRTAGPSGGRERKGKDSRSSRAYIGRVGVE